MNKQRQNRKNGQLSEERIRRLDEIGFIWNSSDIAWEKMFAALMAYKEINGHCNVPNHWMENPQLATWVAKQRERKKKGTLSDDWIYRINQIGFVWEPRDALWEEKFLELRAFKETHGHCNVPNHWVENPQLATWVAKQRERKKKGTLSTDRICRLSEIGFTWEPYDAFWEARFEELEAFRESQGDCKVSQLLSENERLATWVSTQRVYKKMGKLSEERIQRLDKLGFVWDLKGNRDSS